MKEHVTQCNNDVPHLCVFNNFSGLGMSSKRVQDRMKLLYETIFRFALFTPVNDNKKVQKFITHPLNSKPKWQGGWEELVETGWPQAERPSGEVEHQPPCSASAACLQPAWSNLLQVCLPINVPGPLPQAWLGAKAGPTVSPGGGLPTRVNSKES